MRLRNMVVLGVPIGGGSLYFTTSAIGITPTPDVELLTNPSFTAWTGDDPDGWGVGSESGHDPEVTERDSGQSHADTKTVGGAANIYNSGGASTPTVGQVIPTLGYWLVASWVISKVVAGSIRLELGDTNLPIVATSLAATGLGTGGNGAIVRGVGTTKDITVDSVSVKHLLNVALHFVHAVSYGDFSVTLTISPAYFQAGVDFNVVDNSNYLRLYLDRLDSKVHLIKVVSGTTTELGAYAVTYAAGATLTARRHQNGTMDVIYNGATLVSGVAATGLSGKQAGPFLTDSSGVTISNYSWDARSTT